MTRKVALPAPNAIARFAASPRAACAPVPAVARPALMPAAALIPAAARMAPSRRGASVSSGLRSRIAAWMRLPEEASASSRAAAGLLVWPAVEAAVWEGARGGLGRADTAGLPTHLARELDALAADLRVVRAARDLGLAPLALVVGLLARRDAAAVRSAARVARALLAHIPESDVAAAAKRLFGQAPLPA